MNDLPDRLKHAEGLEVHEAQDGLVVFNPETDCVHHLNGTAAVVFELCDGSRETADLPALVAELFSLDDQLGSVGAGRAAGQLIEHGVLVQAT